MDIPAPVVHGPVLPGQTARMRETILVPQSFLTRALQAGTRTITVTRVFQIEVFTGQFTTLDGVAEINLTGSLGAGLQISRIDLRFQNEAVQIIVPQYHPPEVRVDLTYTGTGLFRAVWEVADPRVTAAGGTTIFRVLRQDRIRLGIGGFTRVKGPNLPAELTGLYVVRFRVLDGPLAGQAPIVRYFVKAASPDGEDWWKRYIRPHTEGEGMVRVPVEPEDDSLVIEDEPSDEGGAAEETAGDESAADEPASDEPATEDPASDEPAAEGSTGEEAAADEPAEEETAAADGTPDEAAGDDAADGGTANDGETPQE